MNRGAARAVLALLPALLLGGCEGRLGRMLRPSSARERYIETLRGAGLGDRALARAWIAAGRMAVDSAPLMAVPFEETGYIAPERPDARGYRIAVRRGQLIEATFVLEGANAGPLFADLYEIGDSAAPSLAASADSGATTFSAEIGEDGEVVLRIQPELLGGGRYSVRVRLLPLLGFPVGGAGQDAIRSRFGATRDGGRRNHEGIDIFAPRGTPVIAAESGEATWVGDNELGGRVIMVRDARRNESHYYAHLEAQLVSEGDVVRRGDTIGMVGNTGNARTTPPHLHFGIYARGAVDPYPYVALADTSPEPLEVPTDRLGDWVRVGRRPAALLIAPSGDTLRTLQAGTVMHVLAGAGRWYRVRLPDLAEGFVVADRLVPAAALRAAPQDRPILERPDTLAVAIVAARSRPGAMVVGEFGGYELVQLPDRSHGWVAR